MVCLFPKNKDIWIFGSLYGNAFNDNSRYFYLYILKEHPEIKAIWLYKKSEIKMEIDAYGGISYHIWSIKGIYYSLIAKFAFTSYGIYDINPVFSSRLKRIELWHGINLKNINPKRNPIMNLIHSFFLNKPDNFISTSKNANEKLNDLFKINPKKILITGYPRNDCLFDSSYKLTEKLLKIISNKKVILYLPTWRTKNADLFYKYGFNPDEIQNYLVKENMVLIVKAHHMTNQFDFNIKYPNIVFLKSTDISDIYPLLRETDILITDYSSVYFDYLLLNKPIIFTPFDIFELNKDYFAYDYNKTTPGEKISNWNKLVPTLKRISKKDVFKEKRLKCLNYFHKFNKPGFCKRLYDSVLKL